MATKKAKEAKKYYHTRKSLAKRLSEVLSQLDEIDPSDLSPNEVAERLSNIETDLGDIETDLGETLE